MNCTPVEKELWSIIGQFHRAAPLVDMYHCVKVKEWITPYMHREPILSPTGGNKLNILYIWLHDWLTWHVFQSSMAVISKSKNMTTFEKRRAGTKGFWCDSQFNCHPRANFFIDLQKGNLIIYFCKIKKHCPFMLLWMTGCSFVSVIQICRGKKAFYLCHHALISTDLFYYFMCTHPSHSISE